MNYRNPFHPFRLPLTRLSQYRFQAHAATLLLVGVLGLAAAPQSARADCDPELLVPVELAVGAGQRVLLYGDSITNGSKRTPYHYSILIEHLLHNTYCDLTTLEVVAKGRGGSHYVRYARKLPRFVERDARDGGSPFAIILFQDAGRALKLDIEKRPDSPRIFSNAVRNTVAATRTAVPAAELVLMSTSPLDVPRAKGKFVRLYEKQNGFLDHNLELAGLAAELLTSEINWADDTCEAFLGAPEIDWTGDGVHPDEFGHLLLALSTLRGLGAPLADLNTADLGQFSEIYDAPNVAAVVSLLTDPPDLCAD